MKWPYYAISTHCVGVWVVLEVMLIRFWVVVGYNLPLRISVSGLVFIHVIYLELKHVSNEQYCS